MLHALNDFAKVQIQDTKNQLVKTSKETSESGVLVSLPEKFTHYGFYSFAFDNSLDSPKLMKELHEYWSKLIGKKVFWLALSEKGATLKEGDETFVLIKLTSLIAYDDADSKVRNIHSDGKGAFKA